MTIRHPCSRAFRAAIGPIFVASVFSGFASAADNVRVVPLASDDRGNQAWVEIESDGARATAKPFVAVGEERFRKALDNPNENGALAIPIPKLMRFVERAREALRDMKRAGAAPAAQPASPDAALAAPRRLTSSLGPPAKSGDAICPPAAPFSSASR